MSRNPTGVTALAYEMEEREISSYFDRARRVEVNRNEAIDSLEKMARSKVWWLRTHGEKRPANDVAVQERHLAVLVQTADTLKRKRDGADAAERADERTG